MSACKWCPPDPAVSSFGCGCVCHNIVIKREVQCSKDNPNSRSVMRRIEVQSRRGVPGSEVFLVCCGGAPFHAFAIQARFL